MTPPEVVEVEPDQRTSKRRVRVATVRRWYARRSVWLKIAAGTALAGITACLLVYAHYAHLVSEQLRLGSMQVGTMVFSRPFVIERGDAYTEAEVINYLQRAGYRENAASRIGQFRRTPQGLEISTGPESYFESHVARIQFANGRVSRIRSLTKKADTPEVMLEPELVTNLVAGEREKRRPVQYSDLPKDLIQALVSTEDKRFFDHAGLDVLRVGKAAYIDLKEGRKEQGASTLTMQLARSFWLDQEKTWRRKFSEVMITLDLERRFTKEQILELYANEVYLGRRGSFSVHGFGQAARSYFNKDVNQLTLPEAALLVGMIQRPSYYNPWRYPDRAKTRRDLVLTLMYNNGYISAQQLTGAQASPIHLITGDAESTDAPYYVDLVNNEVDDVIGEKDLKAKSFRVYTSLDMELQRQAVAAIKAAIPEVDKNARAKHKKKAELPQVALVALDPHTGAVRALVGGRNYAQSQLNRTLAKRPPGSSFKPFVYAAALNTGVTRKPGIMTIASHVDDEPTTFRTATGEDYQPGNFDKTFRGSVSLREALMKSLNVPTVKVAEKAGFDNVVQLAKAAGLNEKILPTPAMALGAYEVTPLEIADAYTVFSNGGKRAPSFFINSARDAKNKIVYIHEVREQQVLDPRVAYLMVNMLEDVINHGTAAGARSRGFRAPAAGKTGTSHDGWFAGFTSNLLAVVWVGYDDYTELDLEGAKSALPIWTEFMKRALELPQYRNVKPFTAPAGIVRVEVCSETGELPGSFCPVRTELFVAGTQPRSECTLHVDGYYAISDQPPGQPQQNRPGFFGRVFGVFR